MEGVRLVHDSENSTIVHTGFVSSPIDGAALFYEDHQPTHYQHTLVLSDGIGCDGYVWRYIKNQFAANCRILHWNYRGHGRSGEPVDIQRLAIEDLAVDLHAVLETLSIEQPILVGHSLGVSVSLQGARTSSTPPKGLVLLCGTPANPLLGLFHGRLKIDSVLPIMRNIVERAPGLFQSVSSRVLQTRLAKRIATAVEINPDLVAEEDLDRYFSGLARVRPQVFVRMLEQCSAHDSQPWLGHLSSPALIIAGAKDNMTPSHLSHLMNRLMKQSSLVVIADGSHTAPIERPTEVNQAISQFLNQLI